MCHVNQRCSAQHNFDVGVSYNSRYQTTLLDNGSIRNRNTCIVSSLLQEKYCLNKLEIHCSISHPKKQWHCVKSTQGKKNTIMLPCHHNNCISDWPKIRCRNLAGGGCWWNGIRNSNKLCNPPVSITKNWVTLLALTTRTEWLPFKTKKNWPPPSLPQPLPPPPLIFMNRSDCFPPYRRSPN